MKTNKKGISLIVLVITIIVMIILAAAIILSLSASDIRGKANEAVSSSDLATAKEIVAIARSEWEFDEGNGEDFRTYANKKLAKAGLNNVVASNTGAVNIKYTGKDNRTAIIPEGFTVSTKKGEDTVTGGLVIVDEKGNEFVWVPVDDFTKFQRTTTYDGNIDQTSLDSYMEPFKGTTMADVTIDEVNDITKEHAEYNAMIDSVQYNGGFYIGRYEAGTNVDRVNNLNDYTGGTTELYVQKNKYVYVNTDWSPSITGGDVIGNVGESGKGAVELSRNMYKSSKSVASTLCYGVQWDSALQFIYNTDKEYPTKGEGNGYFSPDDTTSYSKPILTGSVEQYARNNIYDMAGNAPEWTMEANATYVPDYNHYILYRVSRGGGFTATASGLSASHRSTWASVVCGFRIALYIK